LGQCATLIAQCLTKCLKRRKIIDFINVFIAICEKVTIIINTNLTLKLKPLYIFAGNFLKTI